MANNLMRNLLSLSSRGLVTPIWNASSLLHLQEAKFFSSYPKHTKLGLPALSPTMKTGNIVKWLKKEGDKLVAGDVICEVETDKAVVGFEMQEEGYLAKIIIPEGTKNINLGDLVAIVVDSAKDVAPFKSFKEGGAEKPVEKPVEKPIEKPQPKPEPEKPKASGKKYSAHVKLGLPALSPTMKTGKIVKWLKKEGDKLLAGDVICEVETDKAVVGFEMQEESYLAKIVQPSGKTLELGEIVAITVGDKAQVAEFADFTMGAEKAPEQKAPEQKVAEKKVEEVQAPKAPVKKERILISPLATKLANEKNISVDELNAIQGTGPNSRIVIADVESYLENRKPVQKEEVCVKKEELVKKETPKPKPKEKPKKVPKGYVENSYEDIPVDNTRQTIAERLTESKKQSPHWYVSMKVQVDDLLKLRTKLNKDNKLKISINDMIIKAAACALRDFPDMNSQWMGNSIRRFKNADISVAVNSESGLITPIIYAANLKGLKEISKKTKELIEKANKKQLQPLEFIGGTFTISNVGMFNVLDILFPIINPPQSAILGVGMTEKKLIPVENSEVPYKVVNVMTISLAGDHRNIDGGLGTQFMGSLKGYLENPLKMLL